MVKGDRVAYILHSFSRGVLRRTGVTPPSHRIDRLDFPDPPYSGGRPLGRCLTRMWLRLRPSLTGAVGSRP